MSATIKDAVSCHVTREAFNLSQQDTVGDREGEARGVVSPWTVDVWALLDNIFHLSGQPNHRNGFPSPPPHFRFVEFVLRRFFDLTFTDSLFFADDLWRNIRCYKLYFSQDLAAYSDRSIMVTWNYRVYETPRLSNEGL